MRETIEFRIPESYAERHLPSGSGTRMGIARRLELGPDDPLFAEVGRVDRKLQAKGSALFTAWIPHRRYSARELAEAKMFKASAKKIFEPAGEECGTRYDDSRACPVCGGGALQVTPLFLDGRRIPPRVDFAETIAGEKVVSRRVVELFREEGLRGADFESVRLANVGGEPSEEHYQLRVVGEAAQLDSTTRVGNDPFDDDRGGRCPRSDLAGLNLLSEVRVQKATYSGSDLLETKELIGVRRGLLRPRPVMLLSARAWKAMDIAKLKGLVVEVAYLV